MRSCMHFVWFWPWAADECRSYGGQRHVDPRERPVASMNQFPWPPAVPCLVPVRLARAVAPSNRRLGRDGGSKIIWCPFTRGGWTGGPRSIRVVWLTCAELKRGSVEKQSGSSTWTVLLRLFSVGPQPPQRSREKSNTVQAPRPFFFNDCAVAARVQAGQDRSEQLGCTEVIQPITRAFISP